MKKGGEQVKRQIMFGSLKRRKAPGNPEAAVLKRWSVMISESKSRRTNATIAESAAKELESLAVHMPNVSGKKMA